MGEKKEGGCEGVAAVPPYSHANSSSLMLQAFMQHLVARPTLRLLADWSLKRKRGLSLVRTFM